MDINTLNNIQNINNINQNISISKAHLRPNLADINPNSNLALDKNSILRSEFSQNIQTINDGIGKTQVAKASLDKLQDFLTNIQDKLENSQNLEDKNILKQEINNTLKDFTQKALDTKYQGDRLLANKEEDKKEDTIQITSQNTTYTLNRQNVTKYANEIFDLVNGADLNKEENLKNASNKVSEVSNKLEELSKNFLDFSKQLQNDAKNMLEEQHFSNNIDFGKESSDFSRANIIFNAGYLASSQANIVQEQSVRLLS